MGGALYSQGKSMQTCQTSYIMLALWPSLAAGLLFWITRLIRAYAEQARAAKCKRAEAALEETQQRLQALLEAAPLAIITRDRDGLITTWNATAERMFGW